MTAVVAASDGSQGKGLCRVTERSGIGMWLLSVFCEYLRDL